MESSGCMEIASCKEIFVFYEKNHKLYDEINDLFGEVRNSTLSNIMKNLRIFNVYKRSKCRKFTTILQALDEMTDNHVLVCISELQLYGLFEIDDYFHFTRSLHEKFEDDGISSNSYQVVLNNSNQKLVFLWSCTDKSTNAGAAIEKITKYVKDFFGSTITVEDTGDKLEITINKIILGNNRNEQYDNLFNYICQRDRALADKLTILQTYREREYRYTIPKIKTVSTMEDLMTILKTSHNITINAPIIINNGGVNNIGCVINNVVKINKKELAQKWIVDNPPDDKEITTDYYNRYATAMGENRMVINQFGAMVAAFGYSRKHIGNSRYWTK